jgi:heme-degrading monooxygenase HmoA
MSGAGGRLSDSMPESSALLNRCRNSGTVGWRFALTAGAFAFNLREVAMIAVIFEVIPAPGRKQEYLDLAAALRPELEKIDGFISIERFASLTNEGKILSLSVFRDEAAVRAWRNVERHRLAQARGRAGIFSDYRIRVAAVMRDYSMFDRAQVPEDSAQVHKD